VLGVDYRAHLADHDREAALVPHRGDRLQDLVGPSIEDVSDDQVPGGPDRGTAVNGKAENVLELLELGQKVVRGALGQRDLESSMHRPELPAPDGPEPSLRSWLAAPPGQLRLEAFSHRELLHAHPARAA
jgi:hypothetical protein